MIDGSKRMFENNIKNIAVLVYGQYRTGDLTLPYIKKFYENKYNVNVDFFVSLKSGTSYANNSMYIEKHNNRYHIEPSNDGANVNTINKILNPVSLNVISSDDEPPEFHGRSNLSRVVTGFVDVVRLKQIHENQNNFKYDMVFLQRFDVFMHSPALVDATINWYNDVSINEFCRTFMTPKKSFMFVENIPTVDFGYTFNVTVQDLVMWGSSLAFDLMMFEALAVPKPDSPADILDLNIRSSYNPINNNICGHVGYANFMKSASVCQSLTLPKFTTTDHPRLVSPSNIERHKTVSSPLNGIRYTVVRPSVLDTLGKDIDLTDAATFNKVFKIWGDES